MTKSLLRCEFLAAAGAAAVVMPAASPIGAAASAFAAPAANKQARLFPDVAAIPISSISKRAR